MDDGTDEFSPDKWMDDGRVEVSLEKKIARRRDGKGKELWTEELVLLGGLALWEMVCAEGVKGRKLKQL